MTAATPTGTAATGFFAGGSVIAGAGGGEGGNFLGEPRGTTMRAFSAVPFGGADEDFRIAFALGAVKFVNRHRLKIVGAAQMFKRGETKPVP